MIREQTKTTATHQELNIQKQFMEKIRKTNPNLQYNLTTFGCQMNDRDSEKIAGMLQEMGYTETADQKKADIIIFNTCCVRENAENRLYGNLGKAKVLKQQNKNLKIILCGCMMQQDIVIEKIKQSYNFVDIIFGTFNFYRLPQLIHDSYETSEQIIDIWKEHKEIIEDLPSQRIFPFKAGVNIMYGCNNHCSFCIVPYVRGRERSRLFHDIIQEIENLVADGVKEIMLLGQNVNSYGKTLEAKITFAQLLRKVNEIEGLERIRFMTSHPKDLSVDLIEAIAECEKVCKQLHLPVQSGSNDLLTKMRRGYTREKYLELVHKIKALVPGIVLTTDILVGFPTETEDDNNATIDLIKEVEFFSAYTFIYSKREGTTAATMTEQIPEAVAKERFNKVLDVLKPIALKINRSQIGTRQKVLAESLSKNHDQLLTGRLNNGLLVHFPGTSEQIGQMVDVDITDGKTFYLIGKQGG
ncbi:MAG: tRNA (N6-isopentenyl adenosine(37)-C2)-methylthiotransferase MiaB [Defluviitaleaceae bacterium]|nr:tRNA (N6-isopentenyl adenosine(37)-C2)-methylthiotransferase MiaB [Defluviitaleaceae bacterium]